MELFAPDAADALTRVAQQPGPNELERARARRQQRESEPARPEVQHAPWHSPAGPAFPPLARGAMVAGTWRARPVRGTAQALLHSLLGRDAGAVKQHADASQPSWMRAAVRRRRTLAALVLASAGSAGAAPWFAWPAAQFDVLHATMLVLFTAMFAWIAVGFWTAVAGFMTLVRSGDPFSLAHGADRWRPIDPRARTAIVMPICNEEVATVFAGLRATAESLAGTGALSLFDFFVLSDTRDPDLRVHEITAFAQLKRILGAGDEQPRLFYRWRGRRSKKKAGNVADFCRRWGRAYRYMVVLDADSVMSGDCLVSLVRLMEAHPTAGIVQTAPRALGPDTLHGRAQQSQQRVTGPLFTAGMQAWQLGESHYWGHNAIIRVAPFMQHCALARLPGAGLLAGDVMSHDFVGAALMRRAGWHVWVVPHLTKSYEQAPSSLAAELQRDRRWCHGNLQNARLIGEPGLHVVHRVMFATGWLSYVSAPLWLALLLGSIAAVQSGAHPIVGGASAGLAVSNAGGGMLALLAATLAMLMLPKLLGIALVVLRKEQHRYGGTRRLLASGAADLALSMLLAPVRMMFHTQFVLSAWIGQLTGWKIEWRSPPRSAQATPCAQALRLHGTHMMAAAVWLGAVFALAGPGGALWLAPVLVPLLLAAPLSVFSSLKALGRWLQRRRLFTVPEETWTPAVLRNAHRYALRPPRQTRFDDAVRDTLVQAEVARVMGRRDTLRGVRSWKWRSLAECTASRGLDPIGAADRMHLLSEPQALTMLPRRAQRRSREL
jgi:membrane glycosyltransferase